MIQTNWPWGDFSEYLPSKTVLAKPIKYLQPIIFGSRDISTRKMMIGNDSFRLLLKKFYKQLSAMDDYYEEEEIFPWEGRVLCAANLPYNVTPVGLRDHFLPKGKILRVDIERNKKGDSNGLGYIEFFYPADCAAAAELNGTQFEGRTLKCQISTRPPAELKRYYIRKPENRPISDRTRKNIIEEAKNGPIERPGLRERKFNRYGQSHYFRRRNNDDNPDDRNNGRGDRKESKKRKREYSYSSSSDYSSSSYSD